MKGIIKQKKEIGRILSIIAYAICILPLFILSSCSRGVRTSVVVAGSTSVQPYAEILQERYESIYKDSRVEVQGGGSSAGITAVISKTADIGMSSRELKDAEKGLYVVEIAKDGLVLIVNPKNPIINLSLEDIQGIYSGQILSWSELGGNDSKIHIITREEGSGTRSAFEELAMKGVEINPKAIVQDSNGAVRQLVSSDANAIGYVSLGIVDSTVKAVSLNGIAATFESVADGTYILHRPFLFVTDSEPAGEIKKFIDFVMSDEGQGMLKTEGLVPANEG